MYSGYSAYEWIHLLSQYFHQAEFFTRDTDFKFKLVFPGDYNGIPYDVGFARLFKTGDDSDRNDLDEVKHRIALHMTDRIKHLEKELEICRGRVDCQ